MGWGKFTAFAGPFGLTTGGFTFTTGTLLGLSLTFTAGRKIEDFVQIAELAWGIVNSTDLAENFIVSALSSEKLLPGMEKAILDLGSGSLNVRTFLFELLFLEIEVLGTIVLFFTGLTLLVLAR
jgi:hypothetical protein